MGNATGLLILVIIIFAFVVYFGVRNCKYWNNVVKNTTDTAGGVGSEITKPTDTSHQNQSN